MHFLQIITERFETLLTVFARIENYHMKLLLVELCTLIYLEISPNTHGIVGFVPPELLQFSI